ncbi:glycosyltransferase family 2 protein [Pontibacillus sp. HMF3514]|uniref:glycosyltransferase n=1 Tax=Pontibacillus sp. HMF3514 TaxID=2692425 RepID=UPI00132045FA|nr:glycosyltransferase [Pontibacillus sp. HMF3514]QHE52616.1 glycosyltransferase [Pontibacillus sp. HMF3514]
MLYLFILITIFWLIAFIDGWRGMGSIQPLPIHSTSKRRSLLSVIIAAKDEEQSIEKTIRSISSQKGLDFEVIAVNDRSNDRTGEILDNLQGEIRSLKVIHIEDLPSGWLGKNHALQKGYEASSGEYLLFTDGDVEFNQHALLNSMAFLQEQQADHLTVAPDLKANSFWLKAFIAYFLFGFGFFKRPWTANNDGSIKGGMGIGAFQLLSRHVYEVIGTHAAFPLRPDDDLHLGQTIKSYGYKQRLATGFQHISVEWYPSLKDAIKGLEKNTFAGLYYSYLMSLFAIIGTFISQVLPFLILITSDGLLQAVAALNILLMVSLFVVTTRKMSTYSPLLSLILPFSASMFIYATVKAVWLTYKRGGIMWRGTFYSIKELKKKPK